jgi:hypothetical protein
MRKRRRSREAEREKQKEKERDKEKAKREGERRERERREERGERREKYDRDGFAVTTPAHAGDDVILFVESEESLPGVLSYHPQQTSRKSMERSRWHTCSLNPHLIHGRDDAKEIHRGTPTEVSDSGWKNL